MTLWKPFYKLWSCKQQARHRMFDNQSNRLLNVTTEAILQAVYRSEFKEKKWAEVKADGPMCVCNKVGTSPGQPAIQEHLLVSFNIL